jgi:hypothetical protein
VAIDKATVGKRTTTEGAAFEAARDEKTDIEDSPIPVDVTECAIKECSYYFAALDRKVDEVRVATYRLGRLIYNRSCITKLFVLYQHEKVANA